MVEIGEVARLSAADARRIAVRAQLLDAERPTDLLQTVRQLTMLQFDPISAVAPSADLVMWSRLGSAYETDDLTDAQAEGDLVELLTLVRPAEDVALYRAEMDSWPGTGELKPWQIERAEWVEDNDACRQDLLQRLEADGPLASRDLPDTCVRPWGSSGWNNAKNVTMLLEFMTMRGEVGVAGRTKRDRLWDLATRIYPDEPAIPAEEATRIRDERRLRSLGIARAKTTKVPVEPYDVGSAGVPATVDGVAGEWRVDPAQLDRLGTRFRGRAALLSPFDRLVHDRKRAEELFGFEYVLEMYKPAAKRRWGYFALPILHGDRLVGKLDATADRKAGRLFVDAVHEDAHFSATTRTAVEREIDGLADWLGLARGEGR